jgi:insertion element IS1 protein InsB
VALYSKKKNKCWVWLAYDRDGKRVCGVQLGRRDKKTCAGLWQQLEMFDIEHVCTDYYPAYRQIVPKDMHVETKAETAAVEGLNSRIRHYLARFHRKTFCYSKAIYMVKATLTVFFTQNWAQYLY